MLGLLCIAVQMAPSLVEAGVRRWEKRLIQKRKLKFASYRAGGEVAHFTPRAEAGNFPYMWEHLRAMRPPCQFKLRHIRREIRRRRQ